MTPSWLLLALGASVALGLLESQLGIVAWALPSVGVAVVVVSAWRANRPRHRLVALLLGLSRGLWIEGGLLVPVLLLLGLGGAVRATRRIFPLETGPRRFVLALLVAGADQLVLLWLDDRLGSLDPAGARWATLGTITTAGFTLGFDALAMRRPTIRHALERR